MKSKTICMKKILCLMFVAVFAVMCAAPLKVNAASSKDTAYVVNHSYPAQSGMGVTKIRYRISDNGALTFSWADENFKSGTKVDFVVWDDLSIITKRKSFFGNMYGYHIVDEKNGQVTQLIGDVVCMQVQGSEYITVGYINTQVKKNVWHTCQMVVERGTEGQNLRDVWHY